MAIVSDPEGRSIRGKTNKKSKEVHRMRNGREFVYSIENPYDGPASKAQKNHRSIFGKTNAIVNRIMADPEQVQEWQAKMEEYKRTAMPYATPGWKPFRTVRQYIYSVISEQLKNKPAARRRKANLPIILPRGVRLQIKAFSDLKASEIYEILKARCAVFVCEQHIQYLDEDDIDVLATHFSIRRKGVVIAYARLYADKQKGVLRVGRMLSLERGNGYAKYILQHMILEAKRQGAHTLRLHAQVPVVPFYEHLGFDVVGDAFTEAGLPHVTMEMTL